MSVNVCVWYVGVLKVLLFVVCGVLGAAVACVCVCVCVWYAVYGALCPDEVRILVLPWHRLNSLSTQGSLARNDLPRIP